MSSHSQLTRRLFAAHALGVAAGPAVLAHGQDQGERPSAAQLHAAPPVQIRSIKLQTSQPLGVMKTFYAETIGLPVEAESESSVTFRTGTSTLTFEHAPGVDAFYHFAFNIPENQIAQAHAWQKQRTDFIVPPPRLNDPDLPREVVAFRNWNAHSIFFWDPAGNAVEYIARHTLDNAQRGDFSLDSILHLSEIGLITDDVPATATQIKQALDVPNYSSRSEEFEALGDEHGLLLVFKKDRPMAFGQGGSRDIFPTEVHLEPQQSSDADPSHVRPEQFEVDAHPYSIR